MAQKIRIHLQEGFEGDEVIVRTADRELLRVADVSTKLLTGHAGSFEIEVPSESDTIEIDVPSKGYVQKVQLQRSDDCHLGVSAGPDGIEIITSGDPFGYM